MFHLRGKPYVAKWNQTEEAEIMPTVKEHEERYTKAEVMKAKEAYEMVKNSGYPSIEKAIHRIKNGNIVNLRENLKKTSNELSIYMAHL
jgi:nucleoid-associated protein YgaU